MDTMKWNWSQSSSFIFFLLCEVERRDVLQWSVMDGGDKGVENKTRSKVEKNDQWGIVGGDDRYSEKADRLDWNGLSNWVA